MEGRGCRTPDEERGRKEGTSAYKVTEDAYDWGLSIIYHLFFLWSLAK